MNRKIPLAGWAPFRFLLWVTFPMIVTHRASLAVLPEGLDFLRDTVIPKLSIGKNFVPFWSHHLLAKVKGTSKAKKNLQGLDGIMMGLRFVMAV